MPPQGQPGGGADFYLSFGSNAEQFANDLIAQLDRARAALREAAAEFGQALRIEVGEVVGQVSVTPQVEGGEGAERPRARATEVPAQQTTVAASGDVSVQAQTANVTATTVNVQATTVNVTGAVEVDTGQVGEAFSDLRRVLTGIQSEGEQATVSLRNVSESATALARILREVGVETTPAPQQERRRRRPAAVEAAPAPAPAAPEVPPVNVQPLQQESDRLAATIAENEVALTNLRADLQKLDDVFDKLGTLTGRRLAAKFRSEPAQQAALATESGGGLLAEGGVERLRGEIEEQIAALGAANNDLERQRAARQEQVEASAAAASAAERAADAQEKVIRADRVLAESAEELAEVNKRAAAQRRPRVADVPDLGEMTKEAGGIAERLTRLTEELAQKPDPERANAIRSEIEEIQKEINARRALLGETVNAAEAEGARATETAAGVAAERELNQQTEALAAQRARVTQAMAATTATMTQTRESALEERGVAAQRLGYRGLAEPEEMRRIRERLVPFWMSGGSLALGSMEAMSTSARTGRGALASLQNLRQVSPRLFPQADEDQQDLRIIADQIGRINVMQAKLMTTAPADLPAGMQRQLPGLGGMLEDEEIEALSAEQITSRLAERRDELEDKYNRTLKAINNDIKLLSHLPEEQMTQLTGIEDVTAAREVVERYVLNLRHELEEMERAAESLRNLKMSPEYLAEERTLRAEEEARRAAGEERVRRRTPDVGAIRQELLADVPRPTEEERRRRQLPGGRGGVPEIAGGIAITPPPTAIQGAFRNTLAGVVDIVEGMGREVAPQGAAAAEAVNTFAGSLSLALQASVSATDAVSTVLGAMANLTPAAERSADALLALAEAERIASGGADGAIEAFQNLVSFMPAAEQAKFQLPEGATEAQAHTRLQNLVGLARSNETLIGVNRDVEQQMGILARTLQELQTRFGAGAFEGDLPEVTRAALGGATDEELLRMMRTPAREPTTVQVDVDVPEHERPTYEPTRLPGGDLESMMRLRQITIGAHEEARQRATMAGALKLMGSGLGAEVLQASEFQPEQLAQGGRWLDVLRVMDTLDDRLIQGGEEFARRFIQAARSVIDDFDIAPGALVAGAKARQAAGQRERLETVEAERAAARERRIGVRQTGTALIASVLRQVQDQFLSAKPFLTEALVTLQAGEREPGISAKLASEKEVGEFRAADVMSELSEEGQLLAQQFTELIQYLGPFGAELAKATSELAVEAEALGFETRVTPAGVTEFRSQVFGEEDPRHWFAPTVEGLGQELRAQQRRVDEGRLPVSEVRTKLLEDIGAIDVSMEYIVREITQAAQRLSRAQIRPGEPVAVGEAAEAAARERAEAVEIDEQSLARALATALSAAVRDANRVALGIGVRQRQRGPEPVERLWGTMRAMQGVRALPPEEQMVVIPEERIRPAPHAARGDLGQPAERIVEPVRELGPEVAALRLAVDNLRVPLRPVAQVAGPPPLPEREAQALARRRRRQREQEEFELGSRVSEAFDVEEEAAVRRRIAARREAEHVLTREEPGVVREVPREARVSRAAMVGQLQKQADTALQGILREMATALRAAGTEVVTGVRPRGGRPGTGLGPLRAAITEAVSADPADVAGILAKPLQSLPGQMREPFQNLINMVTAGLRGEEVLMEDLEAAHRRLFDSIREGAETVTRGAEGARRAVEGVASYTLRPDELVRPATEEQRRTQIELGRRREFRELPESAEDLKRLMAQARSILEPRGTRLERAQQLLRASEGEPVRFQPGAEGMPRTAGAWSAFINVLRDFAAAIDPALGRQAGQEQVLTPELFEAAQLGARGFLASVPTERLGGDVLDDLRRVLSRLAEAINDLRDCCLAFREGARGPREPREARAGGAPQRPSREAEQAVIRERELARRSQLSAEQRASIEAAEERMQRIRAQRQAGRLDVIDVEMAPGPYGRAVAEQFEGERRQQIETRGLAEEMQVAEEAMRAFMDSGLDSKEAVRQVTDQLGLQGQAAEALRESAARYRRTLADQTREANRQQQAKQKIADTERKQIAAAEQTLGAYAQSRQLSEQTLRSAQNLLRMRQMTAEEMGVDEAERALRLDQERLRVAIALEREMSQMEVMGRPMGAAQRRGAIEQVTGLNMRDPQLMAQFASQVEPSMREMFLGASGFLQRTMRSIGTFAVRNVAATLVFGLENVARELLRQSLAAEVGWIRVSNALERTGRSSAGLRTELQKISTDLAVPLNEVYDTASALVGVFQDPEAVMGVTRLVAGLELLSRGALSGAEGIRALTSVASAFLNTLTPSAEQITHVADVATVIMDRMSVNIEDTIEGVAALSEQAVQMRMPLELTASVVGAVAKGTGQTGAAAAEQLGRILASLQSARVRQPLIQMGIGDEELFRTREYGTILEDLLRTFPELSAAQQQQIVNLLGGARQARAINAALAEGSRILGVAAEATDAHGRAQERITQIMGTFENRIQRLRQVIGGLINNLIRLGVLDFFGVMMQAGILFLGTLNSVIGAINDFLEHAGPLRNIIMVWAGYELAVLGVLRAVRALAGEQRALILAGTMGRTRGARGAEAAVLAAEWRARRVGLRPAAQGAAAIAAGRVFIAGAEGTVVQTVRRPGVRGAAGAVAGAALTSIRNAGSLIARSLTGVATAIMAHPYIAAFTAAALAIGAFVTRMNRINERVRQTADEVAASILTLQEQEERLRRQGRMEPQPGEEPRRFRIPAARGRRAETVEAGELDVIMRRYLEETGFLGATRELPGETQAERRQAFLEEVGPPERGPWRGPGFTSARMVVESVRRRRRERALEAIQRERLHPSLRRIERGALETIEEAAPGATIERFAEVNREIQQRFSAMAREIEEDRGLTREQRQTRLLELERIYRDVVQERLRQWRSDILNMGRIDAALFEAIPQFQEMAQMLLDAPAGARREIGAMVAVMAEGLIAPAELREALRGLTVAGPQEIERALLVEQRRLMHMAADQLQTLIRDQATAEEIQEAQQQWVEAVSKYGQMLIAQSDRIIQEGQGFADALGRFGDMRGRANALMAVAAELQRRAEDARAVGDMAEAVRFQTQALDALRDAAEAQIEPLITELQLQEREFATNPMAVVQARLEQARIRHAQVTANPRLFSPEQRREAYTQVLDAEDALADSLEELARAEAEMQIARIEDPILRIQAQRAEVIRQQAERHRREERALRRFEERQRQMVDERARAFREGRTPEPIVPQAVREAFTLPGRAIIEETDLDGVIGTVEGTNTILTNVRSSVESMNQALRSTLSVRVTNIDELRAPDVNITVTTPAQAGAGGGDVALQHLAREEERRQARRREAAAGADQGLFNVAERERRRRERRLSPRNRQADIQTQAELERLAREEREAREQAAEEAKRQADDAEQRAEQLRQAIAATAIARIRDPLRAARRRLVEASRRVRYTRGRDAIEHQSALQEEIAARQALADAINARAQAMGALEEAEYTIRGQDIRIAQLRQRLARAQLNFARGQFGRDSAEAYQAHAQLLNATGALRDAIISDAMETIDFNLEMGTITANTAISQLQDIQRRGDLTRDQRRQLARRIKGLQDDIRNQLSAGFNIPDIVLPSPFQVRQMLGIDRVRRQMQESFRVLRADTRPEDLGAFGPRPGPAGPTSITNYTVTNNVQNQITNQVTTPAQVEMVARRVVDLLAAQMALSSRAAPTVPRLVGTVG